MPCVAWLKEPSYAYLVAQYGPVGRKLDKKLVLQPQKVGPNACAAVPQKVKVAMVPHASAQKCSLWPVPGSPPKEPDPPPPPSKKGSTA